MTKKKKIKLITLLLELLAVGMALATTNLTE